MFIMCKNLAAIANIMLVFLIYIYKLTRCHCQKNTLENKATKMIILIKNKI